MAARGSGRRRGARGMGSAEEETSRRPTRRSSANCRKSRRRRRGVHPPAASDRGAAAAYASARRWCVVPRASTRTGAGNCSPSGRTSRPRTSAAWIAPRRRSARSCATGCRWRSTAAGDREPLFRILRGRGRRTAVRGHRHSASASRSVPHAFRGRMPGGAQRVAQSLRHHAGTGRATRRSRAGGADAHRGARSAADHRDPPQHCARSAILPRGRRSTTCPPDRRPRRCSLLLLLESDAPLIVDQPEDDLDNRFITEGVVPRMREEKQRRQFIFSTHNANIPVLGDAELIVGLSASGEAEHGRARIAPEHMGSIDAPARTRARGRDPRRRQGSLRAPPAEVRVLRHVT